MTKINESVVANIIQKFQEQNGVVMQPNQLAHQFRWFYNHLEVAKKEVEVQILAGQFFQLSYFINTFNIQVNQNDCMLRHNPGELLKFTYNYYQYLLAQNFEHTLQLTEQYFIDNFKPKYMILYKSDDESYMSDDGAVQFFRDGIQYNLYYVYFLLLILMKSMHSQLTPKHFLEFDHPKSLSKRQKEIDVQQTQTQFNTSDEGVQIPTQALTQNVIAASPMNPKEKIPLSRLTSSDAPKHEIIVGNVSQFTELPTSDQISKNLTEDPQEVLLKRQNQRLKDVQNSADQLERNHDNFRGTVHDNYKDNGELLLINNSRIIQLQNENLLLKKQLNDYHYLRDEINELKGILHQEQISQDESQLSTAGTLKKIIQQLRFTQMQLEHQNSAQNCLDSLQEKVQELQITNNMLTQQNQNFKNILQEKNMVLAQMQQEKEQLEEGNHIYEANLRKLKNETDNLIQITVQKNMQLINTNKNLQQQVIELQSVLKANSQQIAEEVKNNSQEHQNIIAKYQEIIANKDKQISDLQKQVLETQYTKQQIQFIDTKQTALQNDYIKQKEMLYNKIQHCHNYSNQLKQKLIKQKENNQIALNQCQAQQNFIIKQQQQIKNLIQNYKSIYTQHVNLLTLINNEEDLTEHQILVNNATQNQYNKQCVKYVQLQSQFKDLQQQNQNLQNIIIELQDQINQNELNKPKNVQNCKIQDLQKKLEEIHVENDFLDQQISQLSSQQNKKQHENLKSSKQTFQDAENSQKKQNDAPVQSPKMSNHNSIKNELLDDDFEFPAETSMQKPSETLQISSTERLATQNDEQQLQAIEVMSSQLSISKTQ